MTICVDRLMEIIRHVTHPDAPEREAGADRSTDWVSSYSQKDRRLLAGILSVCAASEQDHSALEAQLHALLEIGAGGFTDTESIAHLREIDLEGIPGSLRDYVSDLLEAS